MGRFNRTGRRTMPTLNTSSLPDLIFTLLFFFMIVTTMRSWSGWRRSRSSPSSTWAVPPRPAAGSGASS